MNIKRLSYLVLRFFFSPFFDRVFLAGRFFEDSFGGWKWAFRSLFTQKLLGFNRKTPFPVSPFIHISNPKNIEFHPDDINNFQSFGIYYQNPDAQIIIGHSTYIAPNVGLITTNHDFADLKNHLHGKDIIIGEGCWIGMNSIILPGVTLGEKIMVGAGSVVTKSFYEAGSIVAGNPAKIIGNFLSLDEP